MMQYDQRKKSLMRYEGEKCVRIYVFYSFLEQYLSTPAIITIAQRNLEDSTDDL
jgi:hypothetical protein